MRRLLALVLLSLIVRSAHADVTDQPVTGVMLQLRQSPSGKQKLVFQSKDPSFPFPSLDGPDDPLLAGATIEIFSPGATVGGPFAAPANSVRPEWTHKFSAVESYQFKRDKTLTATIAITSIKLRSGHGIAIHGDATGLALDGARGTVTIRITLGSLRGCARFTGSAVTKDAPGVFLGKNATTVGLVDCAVSSLTGAAPTCGDGDVDQPAENCDTTCDATFGDLTCRPPGTSNECTCCWNGGPNANIPCCNPSAIHVIYPPSYGTCTATRCDPPDACASGDQCQADHSCCSVTGGNPCVMAYAPPFNYSMIPLNACCPGLECRRQTAAGAGCCAAGGTSCAGDGDCCTGHCQVGGTCEACRAASDGCTTSAECCSGSCSAGTCDACTASGQLCSSGATCCSGTCTAFRCE